MKECPLGRSVMENLDDLVGYMTKIVSTDVV